MLGDPRPWDPLDLPFDQMKDEPSVPRDRNARPSLDEVLALRKDRMATMRQVLNDLSDEKLSSRTVPVTEPGWPEPESYSVRECLLLILNQEWEHRLYAERDLGVLEAYTREQAEALEREQPTAQPVYGPRGAGTRCDATAESAVGPRRGDVCDLQYGVRSGRGRRIHSPLAAEGDRFELQDRVHGFKGDGGSQWQVRALMSSA
jgi:hypothetical protein